MTFTVDHEGRRRLSTTKLLALIGSIVGISATLGKCGYDYLTSVSSRVERIESAMLPILVEFRLRQEMERLGLSHDISNTPAPSVNNYDTIRESAEKWASEQVGQKATKGG